MDQHNRRRGVNKQAPAHKSCREIVREPRPPDDDTGRQQHENQAHDAPEHHLLSGIVFTHVGDLMLIAFQHFDDPF